MSGDLPRLLHQLDVQTQRLQLADQDVEGFRHAGLGGRFPFHDRFVNLGAPVHVVGFRGQQFLQYVGRAVSFERPDFHFSEALAAELGLAAQRLLRNQRIRTDGPGVDLVVHQVRQLEHVDVAHRHGLFESLARDAVPKLDLAGTRQLGGFELGLDVFLSRAVENRRGEVQAERMSRPAQVSFENLADVHTRRNAQRIEHDLNRRAIGQIRHVLFGNDARDHALVAVAAGHLVAHRKLALHGDVALHQLDDAGRQFIAFAKLSDLFVGDLFEHGDLPRSHLFDFVDLLVEANVLVGELDALQIARAQLLDQVARQADALGKQLLVGLFVVQVGQHFLAFQQIGEALGALVVENALFVFEVAVQPLDLRFENRFGALVEIRALAREDLAIDHRAFDAGRAVERGVLHVAGLFAEDRAQQLFFGSQLRFALGRHLADQDVARLHGGADADDAALVQVAEERFGDVGNVAGDFFGAELGVAGFDLELFDVDRSVVVFLDQLFRDHDGVFEVVPAPGHERHQDVSSERQFAHVGARPVGQHVALLHPLALVHDRLLADAGVLVGPLEFSELIDIGADFARKLALVGAAALHAHDDALGVHRIHDAGAFADDHRAGIARRHVLHAGTDVGSFSAQQRNGLALHVRSHQRAVGVVVFEERNQTGRHRDELLGTDVHVFDFVAMLQDEVAGLTSVHQLVDDVALFVQRDVGLGDDVLVFFPRRQVVAMGFELDGLLLSAQVAVGLCPASERVRTSPTL